MSKTNFLSRFLLLVPVLLLCACADRADTVPFPPRAAYLPPPTYRLQAGDTLDLKFLYSPELNEEQTVQLDGHVSFQYAPDLRVAGHTVAEARRLVMAAYAPTLRNAAAELAVKGPLQWKVYVVGEVTTPGEYITQGPPMTLSQAVARAGGLKESADGDNVVLLRRDGDVERAYDVSFTNAVGHHGDTADIQLSDHDVLYVPRTDIAEAGLNWRQYVMQFVPPNISFVLGSSGTVIP
ncbi:MAG TPA: polysaccharide biosynthesis/export family protein [Stellaceae bacterium]|nr:polysaccharide biosynthesis/export family protein [Stellaceae bacterium]